MPTTKRYNSGIQRAKGLLELASGLYDSSLASESWKAAEGVLQTDTPIGNALKLSLTPKPDDRKGIALSFTTGGFAAIRAVAEGKFSLAWVNPSVSLSMAYRGKGPFSKRLPLRTLAVFPSYDVMGFAVRELTGITSISQIKKERFPIKVSIRRSISGNSAPMTKRRPTMCRCIRAQRAFTAREDILNKMSFHNWPLAVCSTPPVCSPSRGVADQSLPLWCRN